MNDQQGICITLRQMGHISQTVGNYEKAKQFYEDAMKIARNIGDRRTTGLILINLSELNLDQECMEQAEMLLHEGYDILEELDAPELADAKRLKDRLE